MNKRSSRIIWTCLFLACIAVAAAFRLPRLALRPMHGDEANQAVKAGMLFDDGVYRYDPFEHHGPTLYYATLPLFWLSGAGSFEETSATLYRLVPALFGIALLGLLWPLRRALGSSAVVWAALLMAVSHAMVYYSRYYIQEIMLVLFTFGLLVCGWRYLCSRRTGWAVGAGLFFGLAHATKETCIIIFVCMGAALVLTGLLAWWREGQRPALKQLRWTHLGLAALAAVAVSVTLYTSFFTWWRGPLDSILTFSTYLSRSEGTGSAGMHDKPWHYYLHVLIHFYKTAGPRWNEAFILALALVGIGLALVKRAESDEPDAAGPHPRHLHRFLAFYAVLTLAAYSVIPYKTPWNLIVFLHPLVLLAGLGAAALVRGVRLPPLRVAMAVLLLAGTAHLAHLSYLGNFQYYADARNPYVYAHPSTALRRLVERVDAIAALHPEGHSMQINIIKPDRDYWPLPWYFRKYDRVGYWTRMPDPADAPFIIADMGLHTELDKALKDQYFIETHALRPNVLLLAYIRQDLWDRFMEDRS